MSLLSGSANIIRYLLFGFNLIFVITGIILISVGVTVTAVYEGYESLLVSKFFQVPTFLIVIGSFIFIIAFFGCCGAIKENYCLILTFSISLIVIFIFELSAGIAGYVLRSDASELIQNRLKETMPLYHNSSHIDISEMWDQMQRNFKCCGLTNYTDWKEIKHLNNSLPMSCCTIPAGQVHNFTCTADADNNGNLFYKGCLEGFSDYIKSHAVSLGSAGIILAVIQAVGTFFACYVAREVKIRNGGTGFF